MDEPQTHELKLDAAYFDAVKSGAKNFAVRRDDRGFQRGDVLRLHKWGPNWVAGRITYLNASGEAVHWSDAATIRRRISYVLTGGQFGIEPGYVVLGLEETDDD